MGTGTVSHVLDLVSNFENLRTEPIEKSIDNIRKYVSDIKIDRDKLNSYVKQYPQNTQLKVFRERRFQCIYIIKKRFSYKYISISGGHIIPVLTTQESTAQALSTTDHQHQYASGNT